MTIKELIQQLQQHDPNTRVVLRGYEEGIDDLEYIQQVKLQLNVNTEEYYGPHEIKEEGHPALLLD